MTIGLAPENMYPVPVLECVAAYEYLVNTLNVSDLSTYCMDRSADIHFAIDSWIKDRSFR